MRAQIKSLTGRITVEVEGETVRALLARIAEVQEILDVDRECGACSSQRIRFNVRHEAGFDFYELKCDECGARFQFGQRREGGGLFPKRLDEQGKPLPFRGWHKYTPPAQTDTRRPAPAPRPPGPPSRTTGGRR